MRIAPFIAAAALFASPALAAHAMKGTPPSAMPKSGLRAELLHDLDDVDKKVMQLATAVPAGKYSWRPARGVRSVSEVYMHIAGGNYFAAAAVTGRPASYEPQLEKIADKERVLDELRKSFEQLRSAILGASDADLDRTVRMVGNDTTERDTFITALNHIHEHLGQSIAYARMNGIVPPWSAQ